MPLKARQSCGLPVEYDASEIPLICRLDRRCMLLIAGSPQDEPLHPMALSF